MSEEARKLRLIAKVKKITDAALLTELENMVDKSASTTGEKKRPIDFAGIWTEEEGDEIKKLIEESCEQIDPNDWK